jgi:ATP-dependent RNA helicase RhlB
LVRKIINKFRDRIRQLTRRGRNKTELPENGAKKPTSATKPAVPQNKPHTKRKHPQREYQEKSSPLPAGEPILWDESQFQVPAQEGKTRFHDLGLQNEIMHAIADSGFKYCTPIQAEILRSTISGSDATGRAQTGTGKTAAFLVTILTNLLRKTSPAGKRHGTPRALILAPTRELVLQIADDAQILAKYCPIKIVAILGGIDYAKQQKQLTGQKVDIVVATPGRLLDFQQQRFVHLDKVEILVIDEADRMLDMGFIPDVSRIVYSTPQKDKRQTLLFSATLTPQVTNLAAQWTKNPVIVEIEPEQVVTDTVKQLVYLVTAKKKIALLYNIITLQNLERVIVFCNRRDETRYLADKLQQYSINCAILSGEVPQHKRLKTLDDFRTGKIRILVATDVAGRGIHIEKISHVVNYTLPYEPEDYVHRIGRTGRAGSSGTSVSFADENDSFYLPDIEEFIGEKLPCAQPEDAWLILPAPSRKSTQKTSPYKPRQSNPRQSRPRSRR